MKKVVWTLMCAGLVLTGSLASTRVHATPQKRWAIVNFTDTVALQGHMLMGPYLVVHDDARMAKGEPCTTFYRFDPVKGPQAAELEFMCKPAQRAACDKTTVSVGYDPTLGVHKLLEYQFAGDDEGHGVPAR
jgi:hypothetical protein